MHKKYNTLQIIFGKVRKIKAEKHTLIFSQSGSVLKDKTLINLVSAQILTHFL